MPSLHRSWKHVALAGGLLIACGVAEVSAGPRPDWLSGRWSYSDDTGAVELHLDREGRFTLTISRGEDAQESDGLWEADASSLTLRPHVAARGTRLRLERERGEPSGRGGPAGVVAVTLRGGPFGEGLRLERLETPDAGEEVPEVTDPGDERADDVDPALRARLVGKWKQPFDGGWVSYTFEDDGDLISQQAAGGFVMSDEARFRLQPGRIVVEKPYIDPEFWSFSFDGDVLVLTPEGSSEKRLTRVGPE